MKIILASASLGRKKVLENLGLKFEVMPAEINEENIIRENPHLSPSTLLKKIAKEKGLSAALKIQRGFLKGAGNPQIFEERKGVFFVPEKISWATSAPALIISADSMVLFNGQLYGKPKSVNDAKRLLKRLSGNSHKFITGMVIISTNPYKIYQESCTSRINFGQLSDKEIDDYVKIANVTSFAGGYAPDLKGGEIIKAKMKIRGSKSNVLGGLPLEKLLPILRENGIKIAKN